MLIDAQRDERRRWNRASWLTHERADRKKSLPSVLWRKPRLTRLAMFTLAGMSLPSPPRKHQAVGSLSPPFGTLSPDSGDSPECPGYMDGSTWKLLQSCSNRKQAKRSPSLQLPPLTLSVPEDGGPDRDYPSGETDRHWTAVTGQDALSPEWDWRQKTRSSPSSSSPSLSPAAISAVSGSQSSAQSRLAQSLLRTRKRVNASAAGGAIMQRSRSTRLNGAVPPPRGFSGSPSTTHMEEVSVKTASAMKRGHVASQKVAACRTTLTSRKKMATSTQRATSSKTGWGGKGAPGEKTARGQASSSQQSDSPTPRRDRRSGTAVTSLARGKFVGQQDRGTTKLQPCFIESLCTHCQFKDSVKAFVLNLRAISRLSSDSGEGQGEELPPDDAELLYACKSVREAISAHVWKDGERVVLIDPCRSRAFVKSKAPELRAKLNAYDSRMLLRMKAASAFKRFAHSEGGIRETASEKSRLNEDALRSARMYRLTLKELLMELANAGLIPVPPPPSDDEMKISLEAVEHSIMLYGGSHDHRHIKNLLRRVNVMLYDARRWLESYYHEEGLLQTVHELQLTIPALLKLPLLRVPSSAENFLNVPVARGHPTSLSGAEEPEASTPAPGVQELMSLSEAQKRGICVCR